MPRFARETIVPVERSRAEIEETLRRYGASEFHSGWKSEAAMIGFRIRDLFVRFVLPFPKQNERRFTHKKVRGFEGERLRPGITFPLACAVARHQGQTRSCRVRHQHRGSGVHGPHRHAQSDDRW